MIRKKKKNSEEEFIKRACEWLNIKAPFYLRCVSTSIEQNSTLSNPRYIGAWLDTKGLIEQFQKDMKISKR